MLFTWHNYAKCAVKQFLVILRVDHCIRDFDQTVTLSSLHRKISSHAYSHFPVITSGVAQQTVKYILTMRFTWRRWPVADDALPGDVTRVWRQLWRQLWRERRAAHLRVTLIVAAAAGTAVCSASPRMIDGRRGSKEPQVSITSAHQPSSHDPRTDGRTDESQYTMRPSRGALHNNKQETLYFI